MLVKSKYNIFSKIRDSEDWFIVNLLSGNADILSAAEAKNYIDDKIDSIHEFAERGYLTDEIAEKKLFKNRYLNFIDSRESDEVQIFFVPNYTCNFACSYCYQDEYLSNYGDVSEQIVSAFYKFIDSEFRNRKKYITVFGGEPLLSSEKQKKSIISILENAKARGLDVAIVTNGYTLSDYIEILKQYSIREIQITLDGLSETHNKRRFLKGGAGTFDSIVKGIDLCLRNDIPVNLRFIADKENISELPKLSDFAIEKAWTCSKFFKTQIGRNYELHHCQENNNRLFTRLGLYEEIYNLLKVYPQIAEFHKPAFSISQFLFSNGDLPDPLFDSCPACKTEWAFDYSGKIFSCTATVGKAGEELGTFFPEIQLNHEKITEWENRDVTSISECSDCNIQLACGGGCGSVAKNKTGKICSPDCRPVKELLELGFSTYSENNKL